MTLTKAATFIGITQGILSLLSLIAYFFFRNKPTKRSDHITLIVAGLSALISIHAFMVGYGDINAAFAWGGLAALLMVNFISGCADIKIATTLMFYVTLSGVSVGLAIGTRFYELLFALIPITVGLIYLEYKLRDYEKKEYDDYFLNKMRELNNRHMEWIYKDQSLKFREEELNIRESLFSDVVKNLYEKHPNNLSFEQVIIEMKNMFNEDFPVDASITKPE